MHAFPDCGVKFNWFERTARRLSAMNFPFPGTIFFANGERRAIDASRKNAVDAAGRTQGGHGRERVQQGSVLSVNAGGIV